MALVFDIALVAIACGGTTTSGGTEGGAGSAATGGSADGGTGAGGSGAGGGGQGGVAATGGASGGAQGGASGSDDGGTDASPVDLATACAKYADEACTFEAKCEPFLMTWEWNGDPTRCRDGLARACRVMVGAKGSNTTVADFLGGANQTSGKSCTELLDGAAPVQFPPGDLANGEPCNVDAQCAGGACPIEVGLSCGSCHTFSKPGDSCLSNGECDFGDRCIAGKCVVPEALGQACDATHPCMQGLTCNGVCQLTAPGGPCPTGYECGGVAEGEYCDGTTCQPFSIGQPGDPCGSTLPCAGGKYCIGSAGCPPDVQVGGACTGSSDCELFTNCAAGTCAELPTSCQ